MKTLILFLMLSAPTWADVTKTVGNSCTPACDYTLSQFQTALDDARTYQDATSCVAYFIQIVSGSTITGSFSMGAKSCAKYVMIRSSGVLSLPLGRVNPVDDPSQLPYMATIKAPANSSDAVIWTVTASKAKYYAFDGLEITCTSPCQEYFLFGIGNNNPGEETVQSLKPSNIWLNRMWIHGNINESSPNQTLILSGTNLRVENSRIEGAQNSFNDSQGVLVWNAWNVHVVNNYLDAAAENIFTDDVSVNVEIRGNYIYKNIAYKWTPSTAAPTGSCYSGERYSHLATTFDYGLQNATFANNGSGAIRVTVSNHGLSTGNEVHVMRASPGSGALGWWTITVIDTNQYDLQGSTFYTTGYGAALRGIQRYVCTGGTWATTSSVTGYDWRVKNNWETKGATFLKTWGNVFENAWAADQGQTAIINQVEPPFAVSDVEFFANKALSTVNFFAVGDNGTPGFPRGPTRINIHDNLVPNLGYPFRGPGLMSMFFPYVAYPPNRLNDIVFRHNTVLFRIDSAAMAFPYPQTFNSLVFMDNIISHGQGGWINDGGATVSGWCSFNAANSTGAPPPPRKNIFPYVEQTVSPAPSTAASPNCTTPNVWPADHSFFTGSYVNKFETPGTIGQYYLDGDYRVHASFTEAKNNATDGRDIGADIDLIDSATATVVSGALNPFFIMEVKPPTIIGTTTATLGYVAPNTTACTVVVSLNEDYSSPEWNAADSGGNPARSVNLTGLTTGRVHYPKVSCDGTTYVMAKSAGVEPFMTK